MNRSAPRPAAARSGHRRCGGRASVAGRWGAGALVAAAVTLPVASYATHGGDEPVVEPGEVVVVPSGHLDLGPRMESGTWELRVRDDRDHPPVWRDLEDVVVHVVDDALVPVPGAAEYAFLGLPEGSPVHVIPQVEQEGVVWVGWNTQAPEVVDRLERGADLSLTRVEGPGAVHLFLQEGVSSEPLVLWSSTTDLPQSAWMEVNTHTHANWVFTRPGAYLLGLESTGTLVDGTPVRAGATLRVAVGDEVDPADLLEQELGEAPGDAAAAGDAGGAPEPT
ncbi:choice-of-anchor M domain-containing protein, partial [Cellulomonas bogoriensis]|uniref:choice-of-anchor M domain-containing protein n=1 Tax=Cellulomonas bogoriensis TaxID=301388 RepID=UPI0012EC41FB